MKKPSKKLVAMAVVLKQRGTRRDPVTTKSRAWELWSRGDRPGDEIYVETFKDKQAAQAFIRKLLAGSPWRKKTDYFLKQRKREYRQIFGTRAHARRFLGRGHDPKTHRGAIGNAKWNVPGTRMFLYWNGPGARLKLMSDEKDFGAVQFAGSDGNYTTLAEARKAAKHFLGFHKKNAPRDPAWYGESRRHAKAAKKGHARKKRARRDPSHSMTAPEMVEYLKNALEPKFGSYVLKISRGLNLADDDSVLITFASVPKGSSELACLNSKVGVMMSIADGRSFGQPLWKHGAPAPAKVTAHQFRGHGGVKMRAKSGNASAVVKYVVEWFKKNETELKR